MMGLKFRSIGRRFGSLCGLALLLCLTLARGQHTVVADSTARRSPGLGGMAFAIADLDGDRKPDLASVEVEREQASSTRYAIRLQFSEGADSYIGVKGPLGGLRLAIRDVNGDDSLDLILTSVLDRRVVQVLLNDGHGKFAPAGGEGDWLSGREPDTYLEPNELQVAGCERLTSPRPWFDEQCCRAGNSGVTSGVLTQAGSPVGIPGSLRSCRGRAPPAAIPTN